VAQDKSLQQFGRRIRELRLKRRLSQEELAERVGIHRNYMSQIENGRRNISLLNVIKLARGLQVSLPKLMEDVD
jgi:transcriptional regulator with XRE-family HTH domain